MPKGRGSSRPRLHDVARLAGVSVGTVSNVLNNPARVTPETRRRVQQAIDRLGFARNDAASSLARGHSRTLGLVVVGLSNSMFVDMARAAQREARADDRALQLALAEDDHELLRRDMAAMARGGVAGMLVAPMESVGDEVERSRLSGCPVVLLNHDDGADTCRALVDNERVGRLAARHLIALGRRRILFLGSDDRMQPVALRRRGLRRAVAEATGVSLEEIDVPSLEPRHGAAVARALAARPAHLRPDAVIGVSDLLAVAAIEELRAAGLRVPEDVAVMGCDHNSAAWGGAVPLTSVSMEGDAVGAEGVRLLLRELAETPEQHLHTTVTIEPSLVAKESTIGRRG